MKQLQTPDGIVWRLTVPVAKAKRSFMEVWLRQHKSVLVSLMILHRVLANLMFRRSKYFQQ